MLFQELLAQNPYGGLPYEKVGDAHGNFCFEGTKKGVVQALFAPKRYPKRQYSEIWKARFAI